MVASSADFTEWVFSSLVSVLSLASIETDDTETAGLTPEESGEGEFIDPFLQVPSFREARALFEKQFLRRKLEECRGNVSLLAEKIGLERSHLYRKLKTYGLEPGK